MAGEDSGAGAARTGGLLGSIRNLAETLVAIAHTRLELFANEIQEERLRLARLGLYAAAALFFLALGVIFLTLWVVILFWDSNRALVIGGFAALYLLIGIVFAIAARKRAAAGSRLFAASLDELEKDRERLSA